MITPQKSFPVFIIPDLNKALEFYVKHFGFSPVFESDWYIHLISETKVELGFMIPNVSSQPEILHMPHSGEGSVFSFEVTSSDDAFDYAISQQLNIILKIKSEEWGQRHFLLKDPNGLILDVVETL